MLPVLRLFLAGHLVVASVLSLLPRLKGQRQMEALDRGVVALRQADGRVYVSWRMLGTDPDDVVFNLYRITGTGTGATTTRLNVAPHSQTTDAIDATAPLNAALTYFVRPVFGGAELAPSGTFTVPANAPVQPYLAVPIAPPPDGRTPDNVDYTYTANDCSAADLDGDGEYELIVKWDPTNSKDNSQSGSALCGRPAGRFPPRSLRGALRLGGETRRFARPRGRLISPPVKQIVVVPNLGTVAACPSQN